MSLKSRNSQAIAERKASRAFYNLQSTGMELSWPSTTQTRWPSCVDRLALFVNDEPEYHIILYVDTSIVGVVIPTSCIRLYRTVLLNPLAQFDFAALNLLSFIWACSDMSDRKSAPVCDTQARILRAEWNSGNDTSVDIHANCLQYRFWCCKMALCSSWYRLSLVKVQGIPCASPMLNFSKVLRHNCRKNSSSVCGSSSTQSPLISIIVPSKCLRNGAGSERRGFISSDLQWFLSVVEPYKSITSQIFYSASWVLGIGGFLSQTQGCLS